MTTSNVLKYPSVSKILDATMAPEKRAALQAWRDRIGEEQAEKIRQAALERGRKIDEEVLAWKDMGICSDKRISDYLSGFTFIAHELPVTSHVDRYQGRLDAILAYRENRILVDFKGSTRWKDEKYLVDYRIQLGAYYGACLEMGHTIDRACVVLFVDGKAKPQTYWRQREDLENDHAEFIGKVRQYELLLH